MKTVQSLARNIKRAGLSHSPPNSEVSKSTNSIFRISNSDLSIKLQHTTMQFLAATLFLLTPLIVTATPVAVPEVVIPIPISADDAPVLAGRSPSELFNRSDQSCKILGNDGPVNCRTGPGFGYDPNYTVTPGKTYVFHCYKSGDCYKGNCTWDKINFVENGVAKSCYVNGYYTDDHCTAARLGGC